MTVARRWARLVDSLCHFFSVYYHHSSKMLYFSSSIFAKMTVEAKMSVERGNQPWASQAPYFRSALRDPSKACSQGYSLQWLLSGRLKTDMQRHHHRATNKSWRKNFWRQHSNWNLSWKAAPPVYHGWLKAFHWLVHLDSSDVWLFASLVVCPKAPLL